MPRCRHDHIRAVHKQAWTLHREGYEVLLVVRQPPVDTYLGMQVITANASFTSILRPILNLPGLFLQAWRLKCDVYILRNPDTIPLALLLWLTGRKVIYDTHEDFSKRPQIRRISPAWLKPVVAWSITACERLLARTTAAVLVTQRQQPDFLGGRTLLQPNAPLVDGPIVEAAHATPALPKSDRPSLIYVGEMTRNRGVILMLDLIDRLNQSRPCCLRLVGWFDTEDLRQEAQRHNGWRYVEDYGTVSHAQSLSLIRDSDVGLALLHPVADYPTSSITKLFEYMQFGVPFIASDFPAWRVSTRFGPPGIYVNPEAPDEILSLSQQLLDDASQRSAMGRAGQHYIENSFNWNCYAESLLALVADASASTFK